MLTASRYPNVKDKALVGSYSTTAFAGGGYVWDAVLEYRVWVADTDGDYYYAFETYDEAIACAEAPSGSDGVLALVLQEEYLDEPEPGEFHHIKEIRIAEWPVEFLSRPRRTPSTIPDFMSPDAPPNRLDVIRGKV